MKRHKVFTTEFHGGILLFLLGFVFLSCATSPKAGPETADGAPDFSVLPSGADIYLWADVKQAKPILQLLSLGELNGKDASQILERTDTALAAFNSRGAPGAPAVSGSPEAAGSLETPGFPEHFFFAGWGNYPNLRAGFSMTFSRDWKKIKSSTGNRYWYSEVYKLGIALGSGLAFASDGDPFAVFPTLTDAPVGFEEFRRQNVLALWLNNPGVSLNRFISALGLPIQIPAEDFFMGVTRLPANQNPADKEITDARWELVITIKTPSAKDARSLLALFSMARLLTGAVGQQPGSNNTQTDGASMSPKEAAALFLANAPQQNGEYLTIRMGPLDENRIALLFSKFSIYSEKT